MDISYLFGKNVGDDGDLSFIYSKGSAIYDFFLSIPNKPLLNLKKF